MANDISPYNPIFYAQEALILLENALGMAARVHRGYDAERRSVEAGDTIQIRKPGTFTAQNAPGSAQDLAPEKMDLVVNQHKEVRISLTDKDLALSEDRIIADHIQPAAYALANDVDLALNGLYADIPWLNDAAGSANIVDLTGPYQTLFDIGVPMDPEFLHLEGNGTQQAYFQQLDIFHDASKRGQRERPRRCDVGHWATPSGSRSSRTRTCSHTRKAPGSDQKRRAHLAYKSGSEDALTTPGTTATRV